jgi:hypothetical protein
VGKVNRSKSRTFREKLRLRLVPVYGVYRCHNCNWRGWLPRSTASKLATTALLAGYMVLVAILLAIAIYFIVQHWPTAQYQY